jgi:SAM-dependent methyltransferase
MRTAEQRESARGDHVRRAYDSFAPYYDAFTAHHDYESWTTTLEGLARAHGLRGNRLFDVACGTGKSFMPFLNRGYDVVACDISPAMLEVAAAKASSAARLEICDMRALPILGSFDLVCCLDDAVNYVLNADELEAVFCGIRRNLAPSGLAVFDTNSLMAYRTFFSAITVIPGDDRILIWDGHANGHFGAGGHAAATFEALIRGEAGEWRRRRSLHRQRHHHRGVVEAVLGRAGLEPVVVHGMRVDGSVTDGFDEEVNSKAVYIARPGAPSEEGR